MSNMVSIKVPFCGLYHSTLSHEIEHIETMEAEYQFERQSEEGIPAQLHVSEADLAEMLSDAADYQQAHLRVAKGYANAFAEMADDLFGFETGLEFEEMTSPKFYNFETDKLYCRAPMATVERLFEISRDNGHEVLKRLIVQRHSSRDGFISYYSNRPHEWLKKPLDCWDYNELETLLLAALEVAHGDAGEFCRSVEFSMIEGEDIYNAYQQSVDWESFEKAVRERREEIEADLRDEDPEWEPPYRCPDTPDLFGAVY